MDMDKNGGTIKMKKMKMFILTAIVSLTVSACGSKLPEPAEIVEGVDKCEICNMQVANNQHANEIMLNDGKALKFDDLGDMYAWIKKNGKDKIKVQYVRDFHSKEWINAKEASYLYDKEFQTPMAFGVLAFKDKSGAEAYQKEQQKGKLLTYEDLDKHSWEPNREMMKKMKEAHGGGHGNKDGEQGHQEHQEHGQEHGKQDGKHDSQDNGHKGDAAKPEDGHHTKDEGQSGKDHGGHE